MDPELLLLEEALSGEELLVYASNLTIQNDYWQNILFPPLQTDELTVDVIKSASTLPVMASISHLGTETKYGSREGTSGQRIEIPKIQRGRWMDEKLIRLLLMASQASGLRRQEVASIVRDQLDDAKYAVSSIRARKEWIAMQAASLGAVTYVEDDVRIAVDYGFTNDQKPVLSGTDRWSDLVNSTPLLDMQTWYNIQKARGVILERAFTSQTVLSYLLNNLSMRQFYFGNPTGTAVPPQLDSSQLDQITDRMKLPRILAYDTVARTENTALVNGKTSYSTVRMTPEDRFVMLPGGKLGDYLWAETTESMVSGIEAEATGENGIYVFRDLVSKHPLRLRTVGVNLAFPSFPYADSVMSATVI